MPDIVYTTQYEELLSKARKAVLAKELVIQEEIKRKEDQKRNAMEAERKKENEEKLREEDLANIKKVSGLYIQLNNFDVILI